MLGPSLRMEKNLEYPPLGFHDYLNRCEFHFLRLHINKTNKYCFIIDKGRVPSMVK